MKGGFNTSGFTIVETMIVLGITTVILLSAMAVLSGKTSQQLFIQSVNDLKTNLQQVINTSSNGTYPTGRFTCNVSAGAISSTPTPSGVSRGQSKGCTFVGKLIDLNPLEPPTINGMNYYSVYTVVGLLCSNLPGTIECNPPAKFSDADPYVLPSNTQTSVNYSLSDGLAIDYVSTTSHPTRYLLSDIPEVAILANPASSVIPGVVPGALQLSLYSYSSCAGVNPGGELLSPCTPSGLPNLPIAENEIDICFSSVNTGQSAKFILSDTGYQATVSLKLFGGTSC